jgi:hypothetical protein
MPTRFNNENGFGVHIVKLNGNLSVRFTPNNALIANYTFQGSDTVDTEKMTTAHQKASGEPLLLRDLELYLEQVQGMLDLRFEGARGDVITFKYDGQPKGGKTTLVSAPAKQKGHEVASSKANARGPEGIKKFKTLILDLKQHRDIKSINESGKEKEDIATHEGEEDPLPKGSKYTISSSPVLHGYHY